MCGYIIFTMIDKTWYKKLERSSLSPPDYVFKIVWPFLYTLLTISFVILITDSKCSGICKPIPFFVIQMIFNIMWTTIFFRYKMLRTALAVTFIIIFFTLLTFSEMIKINKNASYLLVPYILWLCFAAYLNYYIVLKN